MALILILRLLLFNLLNLFSFMLFSCNWNVEIETKLVFVIVESEKRGKGKVRTLKPMAWDLLACLVWYPGILILIWFKWIRKCQNPIFSLFVTKCLKIRSFRIGKCQNLPSFENGKGWYQKLLVLEIVIIVCASNCTGWKLSEITQWKVLETAWIGNCPELF